MKILLPLAVVAVLLPLSARAECDTETYLAEARKIAAALVHPLPTKRRDAQILTEYKRAVLKNRRVVYRALRALNKRHPEC